ncbi:hypothetical protein TRSA_06890 [Treponema saccharophilum]|uniref:WD40 repeat, subgroup n=2 Tax=Treponema saccharophilum TaxID=165 RepID=H7ELG3_9SPIR|nr:hypothetical protein [Treponema saccharophilum]EIC01504.1 WD40 repeat, subgroup [Treponema saccharophilum DSM 2985]BDC95590.1 hypothetical protein TRSA_06890 [Treponema saccharophilum]
MRGKVRISLFSFIFLFILIACCSPKSFRSRVVARAERSASAVAWNPDGSLFAAAIDGYVRLWSVPGDGGEPVMSFVVGGDGSLSGAGGNLEQRDCSVLSMRFSGDGKWLIAVWSDNSVSVTSLDDSQSSTVIKGTSDLPVRGAAFFDSSYSVIIPIDGKNLYEYFRLMETNQFMMRRNAEFASPIVSVDAVGNSSRFIVTSESGVVSLLDARTWNVEREFQTVIDSGISPAFSPDGRSFLSVAAKNALTVTSIVDYSVIATLNDSGEFRNAAAFSPKGKMVAAGLGSGRLKVFLVKNGKVLLNEAFSGSGVLVSGLAYSPDGTALLASLSDGRVVVFDVSALSAYDADEEPPRSELDALTPENALSVSLGLSSVSTDWYGFSESVDFSYRNYFRYPGYWLCGGGAGKASPSGEFPYTYFVGGNSIAPPTDYLLFGYGGMGLVYNNIEHRFSVFSELSLGLASRMLFNNSFAHAHFGRLYPSAFVDVAVGASWRWARFSFSAQYDTNLGFVFAGKLGMAIPVRLFMKK